MAVQPDSLRKAFCLLLLLASFISGAQFLVDGGACFRMAGLGDDLTSRQARPEHGGLWAVFIAKPLAVICYKLATVYA